MIGSNHPYIVRGTSKNGTVTYLCPTPEWAVRKYHDMMARDLAGVVITGPDGRVLSFADLQGASIEVDVPMACVTAHRS